MNLREITRHPSALLLLVQLLGVLLYPLMEDTPGGQAAFGAFGIVVLGLALWVIRRSPWLSWIGFLLALPIFALLVLNVLAPQPVFTPIAAALEAAFYFYATGSLISYMLQDDVASTDELFAVGATCLPCWPGDLRTSTPSARRWCRAVSSAPWIRPAIEAGWSCCS